MLEELRINNFAIIDDLNIAFKEGTNIILGETGAGKSIIISALGLLSGKRAEFDKLRDENKKAFVEGVFSFSPAFIKAHPALNDYLDGERIVVSRSLLPSHQAYCRLNGETVSLNVLKKVMEGLVDIHSQNDSALLLDEDNYLNLLDSFSLSCLKQAEVFKNAYIKLLKLKKDKEEFISANDISQKDYLTFQKEEIEKAHLEKDEIENLTEELKSMESYESLQNAFKDFSSFYYSGEEGTLVNDVLNGLISKLKPLSEVNILSKEGNEALNQAEDLDKALQDLFDAYENLDFSPERIDKINERLFYLTDLQKKYGRSTSEILLCLDNIKAKLKTMESFDEDLKAIESQITVQQELTLTEVDKLTSLRTKAAKDLEKEVDGELDSLGLKCGGFHIQLKKKPLSEDGLDKVLFLISLNQGMRFSHLKDAISGGENSRLSLALKSVFNRLSPYSTLVFDEIDSGISGQIAFKAARKIQQISKVSQVIVITHLPQVAACGQHHYFVYKDVKDNLTSSHIVPIEGKRVEEEIAKMIGGDNPSPSALKASEELLSQMQSKND